MSKELEETLINAPVYEGVKVYIQINLSKNGANYNQQTLNNLQIKLLKNLVLSIEDQPIQYEIFFSPGNKLLIQARIPETLSSGKKYSISISSLISPLFAEKYNSAGQLDLVYTLSNTSPEVLLITIPEKIDASTLAQAASTSKALGSISSATGYATDALGILGIILSADQSGATLKFSQISKLIARHRSLNINYGNLFGKFMDGIANAFDG